MALSFLAPASGFCAEKEDYAAIFALLDSERYQQREEGQRRLTALAENPAAQAETARAIQEKLAEDGVSYEAQRVLVQVLETLPAVYRAATVGKMTPAEITQLAQKLQSPDPATRLFAHRKLETLAENPACALWVYETVCGEIRKNAAAAGDENALLALASRARQTWLMAPDTPENTPAVTETQIAGWLRAINRLVPDVADLTAAAEMPSPETAAFTGFAAARLLMPGGELLETPEIAAFEAALDPKEKSRRIACWDAIRSLEDALACQEHAPAVERHLHEMAKNVPLTPDGKAVVTHLMSLSAPTIAAEFWEYGQLGSAQILEIGVPQKSGPMRDASHFDRLEGGTVRCVQGNNLKPGTYQLGHVLSHPGNPNAYFHLVDLSSPRRQLMYQVFIRTGQKERWTEIVRRTLTPRLQRKECLSTAELVMLARMEREAGVRLAGRFLTEVPESATAEPREITEQVQTEFSGHFRGQKATHHALLCYFVGVHGTKKDAPVLLEAIRKCPSLVCGGNQKYAMGYIAAFCLAQRDPWEGVDAWLLSVLEVDEPLVHSSERVTFSDPMLLSVPMDARSREKYGMTLSQHIPTVGATAAAVWMKRHGMNPQDAGLTPVTDSLLETCGVQAFYGTPAVDIKALAARQKKLP